MKTTTRFIFGLFFTFIVIGVIALTAGLTMGARPEQFLNIDLAERGLSLFRVGSRQLPALADIQEPEKEKRFLAEAIEELKISVASGKVEIYSTTGEEIICYSNREDTIYHQKGNRFILEDKELDTPIRLKIYLPARVYKEAEMELGACRVTIDQLMTEELSLELGAGRLEAAQLNAGKSMRIQVGAGTVEAARCRAENLDLECGIGSLKVCLEGKEDDYDYRLECGIGTILLGKEAFSGIGGEKQINNGTGRQVNAECGMGRMAISFE